MAQERPTIKQFRDMKRKAKQVEEQGKRRAKKASLISLLGVAAASATGKRSQVQAAAAGGQQLVGGVQEETDIEVQKLQQEFALKIQVQQFDQQIRAADQLAKSRDLEFKQNLEAAKAETALADAATKRATEATKTVTEQKKQVAGLETLEPTKKVEVEKEVPLLDPSSPEGQAKLQQFTDMIKGGVPERQAALSVFGTDEFVAKSEAEKKDEQIFDLQLKNLIDDRANKIQDRQVQEFFKRLATDPTFDINQVPEQLRPAVGFELQEHERDLQKSDLDVRRLQEQIKTSQATRFRLNQKAAAPPTVKGGIPKNINEFNNATADQRTRFDAIISDSITPNKGGSFQQAQQLIQQMQALGVESDFIKFKFRQAALTPLETIELKEAPARILASPNFSETTKARINAFLTETGITEFSEVKGDVEASAKFQALMNDVADDAGLLPIGIGKGNIITGYAVPNPVGQQILTEIAAGTLVPEFGLQPIRPTVVSPEAEQARRGGLGDVPVQTKAPLETPLTKRTQKEKVEKAEQTRTERKRAESAEKKRILRIANNEAKNLIRELKEAGIKEQISTDEGRAQLKEQLFFTDPTTGEDRPYTDAEFDAIVKRIEQLTKFRQPAVGKTELQR